MPFAKPDLAAPSRALLLMSIVALAACGSSDRDPRSPSSTAPAVGFPEAPEPAPSPAAAELSPLAEEARAVLRVRQSANLLLAVGTPTLPPRFVHREVDLDGDGQPEVLVLQLGAADCTTASCQLDILARDPNGHLALRQSIRNTAAPVAVGPGATAGWRDLLRTDSAAGDQPAVVMMAFDGQHYLDGERRADWPPEAEILFDAREAWERSIPLTE